MAKFIALEVVGNTNDFENGEQLLNVDQVTGVQQSSDSVVEIFLAGGTPGDKVSVTLSTSQTSSVAPVMTSNLGAKAFNFALTANPGGVKAKVFLGVDGNGDQMYIHNVAFA
jgi:hypothetical protein|tara:strand:- start:313 stop:648 length:336 start_codon:yes stop_codon:yes gene_type:complete